MEKGGSGPSRTPKDDGMTAVAGFRPVKPSAGECGVKDQVSRTRTQQAHDDSRPRGSAPQPAVAVSRSSDVLKEAALQIAIRHGKVEVSPTLRAAVLEKVGRVGRFLDGVERAEVR